MITRSSSRPVRRAAVLAALALAIPLAVATPAQAATAAPAAAPYATECRDGSRDIDATGARDIQRAAANGSFGRMEVTLRSNPSGTCYWGLMGGPGEIWLERWSPFSQVVDHYLYPESHDDRDKSYVHTAAVVTSSHLMRVCGRPYDGTVTKGWNSSTTAGAETSGKTGSASASSTYEEYEEQTVTFADGTVCTGWHGPDVLTTGY